MKATRMLHEMGQSIWLDNITREHSIAAAEAFLRGIERCSRHRHRCSGGPAPGGRRQIVRQVVERVHGGDRFQKRRPDIWKVKACPVA